MLVESRSVLLLSTTTGVIAVIQPVYVSMTRCQHAQMFLSLFHTACLLHRIYLTFRCLRDSDGAASVIRTRDLTLTKGALYRWSYGSIFSISRPVQIEGQDGGGVQCRKFVTGTNSLAPK